MAAGVAVNRAFAWLPVAALVTAGCARFGGDDPRGDHAAAFGEASREQAERSIAGEPLDLDRCIALALDRNLHVRLAQVRTRMARLDRRLSFASFLPTLEAGAGANWLDREPERGLGQDASGRPRYVAMQDADWRTVSLRIQVPIFRPVSWFLYSARARGEEAAGFLEAFVRQRVRMEVTAQYFQCFALSAAERAGRSRIDAAREALAALEARHAQGMAEGWEVDEARALAMAAAAETNRLGRAAVLARSDLMGLLGLSPLVCCRLAESGPLPVPEGELPDRVASALLNHPHLHAADRRLAVAHEQVKAALAAFLPAVVASGSAGDSSDAYLRYSSSASAGVSGVMTLFGGFANVQQFRLARERKREAWQQREEACLAVVLQVARADAALRDAQQECEVAGQLASAAGRRRDSARARWRSGLLSSAEYRREAAECDQAALRHQTAELSRQVCVAALWHAMGQEVASRAREGANHGRIP